jgi:hypothetical protein
VAPPGALNALGLVSIDSSDTGGLVAASNYDYRAVTGELQSDYAGPSSHVYPNSSLDTHQPHWEGMPTEAPQSNLPYNWSLDCSENMGWPESFTSSFNVQADELNDFDRPVSSTSQFPAQGNATTSSDTSFFPPPPTVPNDQGFQELMAQFGSIAHNSPTTNPIAMPENGQGSEEYDMGQFTIPTVNPQYTLSPGELAALRELEAYFSAANADTSGAR